MSFTITSSTAAVTTIPLVMGYAADRESGNILHAILGRTDPDVTLRPLKLRTGTLSMFMDTMAAAQALVTQFEALGWQRLQSTEAPLANMHFVLNGNIGLASDDDTATFTVTADFQEVLA